MATKCNTGASTESESNTPVQDYMEKMDKEEPEKCEDIGKCANMEDRRTIRQKSLSDSTTKQKS